MSAAGRVPIAVLVHDEAGRLVGGISGYTPGAGSMCSGCGSTPASAAGASPARCSPPPKPRRCRAAATAATIDTFNPVALKVYLKAGYVPFGELADFPKGRTRTFLSKPL